MTGDYKTSGGRVAECDHLSVMWKFPLSLQDVTEVAMPAGARVVTAAGQDGVITVWAAVDPRRPSEVRRFGVYATGQALPIGPKFHVGTVFIEGGAYVFHVFELGSAIRRVL